MEDLFTIFFGELIRWSMLSS